MDVWLKAWISFLPIILLFAMLSKIFPDTWVDWVIDEYLGPLSLGMMLISLPFLIIYLVWK